MSPGRIVVERVVARDRVHQRGVRPAGQLAQVAGRGCRPGSRGRRGSSASATCARSPSRPPSRRSPGSPRRSRPARGRARGVDRGQPVRLSRRRRHGSLGPARASVSPLMTTASSRVIEHVAEPVDLGPEAGVHRDRRPELLDHGRAVDARRRHPAGPGRRARPSTSRRSTPVASGAGRLGAVARARLVRSSGVRIGPTPVTRRLTHSTCWRRVVGEVVAVERPVLGVERARRRRRRGRRRTRRRRAGRPAPRRPGRSSAGRRCARTAARRRRNPLRPAPRRRRP